MSIIVPPGGFVGYSQMTPASRASLSMGQPRMTRTSRRRAKKKVARKRAAPRAGKKRGKRGKMARLVRGSAAAKRYMAKIRRKRK